MKIGMDTHFMRPSKTANTIIFVDVYTYKLIET